MAVAPARCLLERVRGLGSHTAHTQVLQACAFAACGVLLGGKECWQSNKGGGGGAGAASVVVVVVWEARLCSECRACVCVCATTQHQGTQRKQRKGKARQRGRSIGQARCWALVVSCVERVPLATACLSAVCVCVCEWLSSVLLCVVTRRCFVQRSACFVHRALCLSLSFSARWCVCWKQVCSLSLSGTKARGGSDAWRLWCVCRWQALCAAVPPIAVCQGCFCVLLLLVVLVVFWWWAMEPLGVCVAMLAWLAFVCVVCCVLATQHVVQTWHCVCVDDALLVVVVVDDDGALDGCLWSMSDGVEGRMGQGNGAVLLLLLLEEEEERLPPVFFVLCV